MSPVNRLCFIGNSHLACVKLAIDADRSALLARSVDYFAGSGYLMDKFHLVDGHFLTTDDAYLLTQMTSTSAGRDRIDMREYDAFVMVGLGIEYRDLFQLFRMHCLASDRKLSAGREVISDSFFTEFLARAYRNRAGYGLTRLIRTASPAPVIFLSSPYPSETIIGDKVNAHLRKLRGTSYFGDLVDFFVQCADSAAASVGAMFIPQSDDTLAAPGFTREALNHRAVGLAPPKVTRAENWHREKSTADPWHMNAEFGAARLRDIAAALDVVFSAPMRQGA
ncbi:hypothetical protein [uncultured Amaricoccus sp.]|uniref:hypothetical protein n=1 Tax=uncultured Amaricoccus sp. TaxID=339341 RepID=UPI00261424B5|nr:hypothetical protein [uncultured Amaricoccus sp.]